MHNNLARVLMSVMGFSYFYLFLSANLFRCANAFPRQYLWIRRHLITHVSIVLIYNHLVRTFTLIHNLALIKVLH